MKYLPIVLMLISAAVSADYLTKDSGEVCTIPDGFNTAPYSADFNLKGMADMCEFPQEAAVNAFLEAIKLLQETGLEHPICVDGGLVFGPTTEVRPCYQLLED
jgi:hypothetical protein